MANIKIRLMLDVRSFIPVESSDPHKRSRAKSFVGRHSLFCERSYPAIPAVGQLVEISPGDFKPVHSVAFTTKGEVQLGIAPWEIVGTEDHQTRILAGLKQDGWEA